MVSALIIAPFHDEVTSSSSVVARISLDLFRRHNFEVDMLERHDATRAGLEKLIKDRETPYSVVFYLGHGTYNTWLGQQNGDLEPMLDSSNISMFKGSVLGALSCSSMKNLLKASLSKGIIGTIGFSEPVYLPIESIGTRSYYSDFMRTFALIPLMIAQGETISECVREFKKLAKEYIRLYDKERPEFYEDAKSWMENNMQFIEYAGDPDTAISPKAVV